MISIYKIDFDFDLLSHTLVVETKNGLIYEVSDSLGCEELGVEYLFVKKPPQGIFQNCKDIRSHLEVYWDYLESNLNDPYSQSIELCHTEEEALIRAFQYELEN